MTRFKLIPIIITLSLLLAGCGVGGSIYSNYRALDKLRLVEVLGVDSAGGSVAVSAAAGKVGKDAGPLLLRRSGESILDAMDSLQDYSDRGRLFFSHVNYVMLGRSFAENGVAELLDFAERDVGMRLDTELFLLENGEAGELILASGEEDFDVRELLESAKRDVELRGSARVHNFRETAVALSEYGAALVCMLRVAQTDGSASPGTTTAVPAGYGILKDGKLAGELDVGQAEAVGLLLGYPGTLARTLPYGEGGNVTLRVDGSGGGFKADWDDDGRPSPVEVTVKVRAVVSEVGGEQKENLMTPEALDALEEALERSLTADVRSALDRAKALDADFLALGKALRVSGGKRFDELPKDWLAKLDFNVKVEAVIDHSYDMDEPLDTAGERNA